MLDISGGFLCLADEEGQVSEDVRAPGGAEGKALAAALAAGQELRAVVREAPSGERLLLSWEPAPL